MLGEDVNISISAFDKCNQILLDSLLCIDSLPRSPLLLHYAPLGDANVVSCGVLDQVHHFVSLADHVMRGLGVVRVGGHAD